MKNIAIKNLNNDDNTKRLLFEFKSNRLTKRHNQSIIPPQLFNIFYYSTDYIDNIHTISELSVPPKLMSDFSRYEFQSVDCLYVYSRHIEFPFKQLSHMIRSGYDI